jgi:alpha-N-acetylglucosaminidase
LRTGKTDESARQAWDALLQTAYTAPDHHGQGTLTNAKPCLTGHNNWTTDPEINYSNADLLKAWKLLLDGAPGTDKIYSFDVVNIGRQVLGNYFSVLRERFTAACNQGDIATMEATRAEMLGVFDDMDRLLASNQSFLLGKWIADARRMGINPAEKNYYEKDARMIITTWSGYDHDLNDYANRSWAGLTKSFYRRRWEIFCDDVIDAARNHKSFDEKAFTTKLDAFQNGWAGNQEKFTTVAIGNSAKIAEELYDKYAQEIQAAGQKK